MTEKSKNILIIILVSIICVLIFSLAFILGMKFVDKEESINNTNNVNDEEVQEDIKVVDYINKSLDKNTINKSILEKYIVCGEPATQKELGTVTVRLPMIDSKKTGAQAFNKMLQDKYADTIESLNPNSKSYTELDVNNHKLIASVFGYSSIDYEYYNSNHYISIIITSGGGMLCGSGGSNTTSYVYDIENDKYLNNEDVLKEFNITKEQIKNKFIEEYPNLESDLGLESSLNDYFENLYYLYIQDGFLNINSTRDFNPSKRPVIKLSINKGIENNKQDLIEFVGDKNTEVTYNPSYQTSYNHNYKINENGKVVFTDIKNEDNSLIYNSIDGVSKYISMAIPTGKQQPYYYIIVITEDGNIYYKEVYAWAQMTEEEKNMSPMNDNFVKLEYNNVKFNGLTLRTNATNDEFETVIISDESGNEYYVKNDNNGLGLLKL